jgi:phosphatidylethanolamine-binding protein (PEBP) family uncharacterized protein
MSARKAPGMLVTCALAATFAFGGCGGSSSKSSSNQAQATSTSQTQTQAQTSSTGSTSQASSSAPLSISSSAILGKGQPARIQARYTCDGQNISPAVSWSELPPGAAEVVVVILHLGRTAFTFDWAIAGLSPKLHGLPAGSVTRGAVIGRNSAGHNGYFLCPAKGKSVRYGILVYALPHKLQVAPGFNPQKMVEQASSERITRGVLEFTYRRA